jgi:predicted transcriptional regulator
MWPDCEADMDEKMLTIDVCSADDMEAQVKAAFRGDADATPRYSFRSREDLLRTLNPNRWGLIEALTGVGPLGVRELARRVGRDVKGVHTDAQALVLCGLIEKAADGRLSFPYDAVHVDFVLRAA